MIEEIGVGARETRYSRLRTMVQQGSHLSRWIGQMVSMRLDAGPSNPISSFLEVGIGMVSQRLPQIGL